MTFSKKATALTLSAAVLLASSCDGTESMPVMQRTEAAVVNTVDPASIRAQDDFYGYVNAAYLLENMPDYGSNSSGSFQLVENMTSDELYGILDEICAGDKNYEPGSTEQLIRDMFIQGMEFEDNASVMDEVRGIVDEIRAVTDIKELMKLWIRLSRSYGISVPAGMSVSGDIYKAGKNALYIRQTVSICGLDLESAADSDLECITARSTAADLLMPFTASKAEAESLATDAIYLMLDIALASDFSVQHAANPFTTYIFIPDSEANAALSNLGASPLELACGISDNPYGGYYIQDKAQIEKINDLLTNDKLEQWKTLLICSIVQANLDFIADEAPSLASHGDTSWSPKEKIIGETIEQVLPDRVGKLYAERYYTDEMDKSLKGMCEELRESYRELINNAEWLTREGRDSLLRKLDAIKFVLGGGPAQETDPADAGLIADTYPETLRRINERMYDDKTAAIGQPKDVTDPGMPAQMVNACYDPSNTVTITVAIMHAPFFDPQASDAANLGGLGMVIGHEMGHAFDSMCMDYDDKGNYNPEWLCEADRNELAARADRLAEYYSEYTVLDVYHVDGVMTNGENYADLGAMECITNAVDTDEELKELFENYARVWAENILDTSAVDQINTDEHSPSIVRVNAVLSSCDKFYEVYDVKEGDGMYRSPEERVSRW